jgi:viroplasmin and RNaseH domain-containing protein
MYLAVKWVDGYTDDGAMIPSILKSFNTREEAQAWLDGRFGKNNESYGVLCDD